MILKELDVAIFLVDAKLKVVLIGNCRVRHVALQRNEMSATSYNDHDTATELEFLTL